MFSKMTFPRKNVYMSTNFKKRMEKPTDKHISQII